MVLIDEALHQQRFSMDTGRMVNCLVIRKRSGLDQDGAHVHGECDRQGAYRTLKSTSPWWEAGATALAFLFEADAVFGESHAPGFSCALTHRPAAEQVDNRQENDGTHQ